MSDAIEFLKEVFQGAWSIADKVLGSYWSFLGYFFVAWTVYRFVLRPIIGGSLHLGSDKVKPSNESAHQSSKPDIEGYWREI